MERQASEGGEVQSCHGLWQALIVAGQAVAATYAPLSPLPRCTLPLAYLGLSQVALARRPLGAAIPASGSCVTRCCACWRKKDVATHTSVLFAVAAWQGYGSTTTNLDSEHCLSHTSVRIMRINDTSRKPRHSDQTNEREHAADVDEPCHTRLRAMSRWPSARRL